MTGSRCAQVAVPVAQLPRSLTYGVPAALAGRCVPGVRVRVHVGGRAVVGVVTDEEPPLAPPPGLKLIHEVLDGEPVASRAQLALCRFVADYYLSPLGEALRLVLPPDTAREVRTSYRLTERGREATVFAAARGLSERARQVLASFDEGEHREERALRREGLRTPQIRRMVEAGLLEATEARAAGEVREDRFFRALEGGQPLPARAPALAALDAWLRAQEAAVRLDEAALVFPGARGKLLRLVALGRALEERAVRARPLASALADPAPPRALTDDQARAVAAILAGAGQAFLLEGVTGSGKTEVYLRVLEETLRAGQGALLIVPEISLTPQLLARVQRVVGADVALLHSALGVPERRDALARLRRGEVRVALGARSALFAPIERLGLIIIDEEHDASLKQDEAPRYHGRDVALWRARQEGARCVLGSATPSLESRHNVDAGKLVHLRLTTRIGGGGQLPEVHVVDLRARKQVHESRARDRARSEGAPSTILAGPLTEALGETLAAGEQALLFLNRRGYASFLLCEACGQMRTCPACSVGLTLHRGQSCLLCHQCDYEEPVPEDCPACGHGPVLALGLGTERVEAEVRAHFPDARIARLDRDTTRSAGHLASILAATQRGEVDVLIGTQMVAKGHDFPGISLVGVVLADVALAVPDFRAAERAFSLLTQVAGRAGRGATSGRVFLQTYNPEHPALQLAARHDVDAFVAAELRERREARYPPYWRAALLRVESTDPVAADALSRRVSEQLRALCRGELGAGTFDVLGPAPAPLEKLRGKARFHVFFRAISVRDRGRVLRALVDDESLRRALSQAGCRLVVDIDPMYLL